MSKFYVPTDSEHKFHETGIENWLPIGFNLELITTTLRSSTNGELLEITLETFHLPETTQVLPDPIPINQSSLNPQQNKNQPPLT